MTSLRDMQCDFFAGLLGKSNTFETQIKNQPGALSPQARFSIYRNAYRVRLIDVLRTDHETLQAYLGEVAFEQMAMQYIAQHPSTYRSLRQLGDYLPSFLAETTPFKQHPILAEIAQFERRLLNAFDAKDCTVIDLAVLQSYPPEAWPEMVIRFHPSVMLFSVQWNSIQVWQAVRKDQPLPTAESTKATWIVWRNPQRLTEFRSLNPIQSEAICCALNGNCFSDICEALLQHSPEEQVSQHAADALVAWIRNGLVHSIQPAA